MKRTAPKRTKPIRKAKRTAPIRRGATRTPKPKPAKRIFPMGGCMPNPPEDCLRPDKIIRNPDGGVWIDINICRGYCPKMCKKALRLQKSRTGHLDYHKEIYNDN